MNYYKKIYDHLTLDLEKSLNYSWPSAGHLVYFASHTM